MDICVFMMARPGPLPHLCPVPTVSALWRTAWMTHRADPQS